MRDKSRSVNSIDIVFNFDCVGFTGTPFIDNYPTFAYISSGRSDAIPQMIDRSFYAYSAEALPISPYISLYLPISPYISFYAYSAEVLRLRMGSLLTLC